MCLKAFSRSAIDAFVRLFPSTYRFLQLNLLPLGATLALVEALYLAWIDRLGGAGIAATLFVLIFLFKHFPQLESFKGLGVEAKMRERIAEADQIITDMRRFAAVVAKQSLTQLAWSGRLRPHTLAEKKAQTSDYESVLRHLKVQERDIDDAKSAIVAVTTLDIWLLITEVVRKRALHNSKILRNEQGKLFPNGIIDQNSPIYPQYLSLDHEISRLESSGPELSRKELLEKIGDPNTDAFTLHVLNSGLSVADIERLKPFAAEAKSVANSVRLAGNITPEAEAFIGAGDMDRDKKAYEKIFETEG